MLTTVFGFVYYYEQFSLVERFDITRTVIQRSWRARYVGLVPGKTWLGARLIMKSETMARFNTLLKMLPLTALLCSVAAMAVENPIGKPKSLNGMEIAAVYLQPVSMEPAGMMRKAEESDVHMEADIHAIAGNTNGFEEGAWIPYLTITYEITRQGSADKLSGDFMPMVANNGPHYGDNIKLKRPGKYKLKLRISPPGSGTHFGRHTDRETGVGSWYKPFEVEYDFTYAGAGKKGGY